MVCKETFHHFKNEMRLHFATLKGLTNNTATRTMTVYKILFLNVYTPSCYVLFVALFDCMA